MGIHNQTIKGHTSMKIRFWQLAAVAFPGFLFATILPGLGNQEVQEDLAATLARSFGEANLELAEVELEIRLTANERAPGAFTQRQIDRSRMKVEMTKEQLRLATIVPKGDATQLHLRHAELEAGLAAGIYERALKANKDRPGVYNELQIKRLRLKAEVTQLRLAIWLNPGTNTLSILDHMHWQIERMSEELVELQDRVDKLSP